MVILRAGQEVLGMEGNIFCLPPETNVKCSYEVFTGHSKIEGACDGCGEQGIRNTGEITKDL